MGIHRKAARPGPEVSLSRIQGMHGSHNPAEGFLLLHTSRSGPRVAVVPLFAGLARRDGSLELRERPGGILKRLAGWFVVLVCLLGVPSAASAGPIDLHLLTPQFLIPLAGQSGSLTIYSNGPTQTSGFNALGSQTFV